MTDHNTKWGTGSAESSQYTYALCADYANADYSADWTDARLRLENIAEAMHGARSAAIHNEERVERVGGAGKLLTMADGSQWFHPFSGGAPVCEVPAK